MGAMPALTRRRSTDAREECWHIFYGDVHAGTIAIRSGVPHDEDQWGWSCGFYPGSRLAFGRACPAGQCRKVKVATGNKLKACVRRARISRRNRRRRHQRQYPDPYWQGSLAFPVERKPAEVNCGHVLLAAVEQRSRARNAKRLKVSFARVSPA
jgi:hypothetical protein